MKRKRSTGATVLPKRLRALATLLPPDDPRRAKLEADGRELERAAHAAKVEGDRYRERV
jgi:hypothetical protein